MQLVVKVQGEKPNRTWYAALSVNDKQYSIGQHYAEISHGEYPCIKTVNNMVNEIANDLGIDTVSLMPLTHEILRTFTTEILPESLQSEIKKWLHAHRSGDYHIWSVGGPNGGNCDFGALNEHFKSTGAVDGDSVLIRY